MKKLTVLLMMMALVAGVIFVAAPSEAQAQKHTYYRKVVRNGRVHWVRTSKPSYYRRHRNVINTAAGAAGGAVLGGIIGGRKGMLIGAGAGAGAGALYTYKIKKKKRVYKRVRNY